MYRNQLSTDGEATQKTQIFKTATTVDNKRKIASLKVKIRIEKQKIIKFRLEYLT